MKRLTLFGALLILLVSCNKNKTAVVVQSSSEKIPVKVTKAESRTYSPYLELPGTAFADQEANLGAALPGRVEKIYFPAGSRVKKGDLLVSLSGEMYTQALVEFKTIEKDYERVSRLNDKGSITSQDYDHVKAKYDASKAKVEMMKKNAEIVAPFSGTIVEYLVNEGENYFFNLNLDPGYSSTSGILRLMKLDPVQVEVEVNEKDLCKIQKGQKALLTFDAVQDTVFTGRISSIKPVLSTMTHTATVKVELRNGSGILKPGMFAHVKIELSQRNAVCVPMNAIYVQPGTAENYLFVIENNTAKRVKIEKLWSDNTWIGVSGIDAGTIVATSGKEKLREGSLVEIK
ncbi:MAG TPA: efflux RND transporter periplasmic adaptor subunit [Bacteroidales bacterium]|nr:efflux RND transporter periplasmic adaptor subunit [Bacteroidales bacterium]HPT21571.1 efflux RND transporter periplasmic adaptor subunit [Bacteroidales bacterium]